MLVADVLEFLVEFFKVRRRRVLALVRLGVHERDVDLQRRIGEKAHELRFRFHLGRHEIQDGDLQRADVLRERPLVAHNENILLLERRISGYILGNDDRHCSLLLFCSAHNTAQISFATQNGAKFADRLRNCVTYYSTGTKLTVKSPTCAVMQSVSFPSASVRIPHVHSDSSPPCSTVRQRVPSAISSAV